MGDLLQELRLIPIFANINPETLGSLSKLLKEERFNQGQPVVREGDHAESMYIIHSGEVEVRKAIHREPEKYKTLAILEEGELFGEMAVFGEEFRSADVIVRKDSVLWKLDYNELFNVLRTDPAGGVKILQVIITLLAMRIKSLNRELTTLYELGQLLPRLNDIEDLRDTIVRVLQDPELRRKLAEAQQRFVALYHGYNDGLSGKRAAELIHEI